MVSRRLSRVSLAALLTRGTGLAFRRKTGSSNLRISNTATWITLVRERGETPIQFYTYATSTGSTSTVALIPALETAPSARRHADTRAALSVPLKATCHLCSPLTLA